eukprot:m.366250 g.366250  ORF g.366250 m.366250 type:complete len:107 (+) comp35261_c0_seq1:69-389(+)
MWHEELKQTRHNLLAKQYATMYDVIYVRPCCLKKMNASSGKKVSQQHWQCNYDGSCNYDNAAKSKNVVLQQHTKLCCACNDIPLGLCCCSLVNDTRHLVRSVKQEL